MHDETLRLYPAVPVTVRVAVRDTVLMGHPLRKGSELLLCPWLVNRSLELWGPDADDFRPGRWIDEVVERGDGDETDGQQTSTGSPKDATTSQPPTYADADTINSTTTTTTKTRQARITKRPNNTGGASSNYGHLTFLQGPRGCIGQNFARAELRCLLAALVAAFEWDLDMDERDVFPAGAVTIKPAHGLKLRVKPIVAV